MLLAQGLLALDQHRPAEAIAPLERALKLAPEVVRAKVQFTLARALWDSNRDRARARELATQAQGYWRQHSQQVSLHEADQWLEAHPTP